MKRLALIICLLLAPSAAAAERSVTYYTINVAPASSSAPATFLTAMPDGGVVNRAYKSGLKNQMWTEVYPEWPSGPSTTANAADAWRCLSFCPYDKATRVTERKFINRAYGRCLTYSGVKAVVKPCATSGPQQKAAMFEWKFVKNDYRSRIPSDLTFLGTGRDANYRCLTATGTTGNEAGSELYGNRCQTGISRQYVRFLPVATATCNAPITVICGTKRS